MGLYVPVEGHVDVWVSVCVLWPPDVTPQHSPWDNFALWDKISFMQGKINSLELVVWHAHWWPINYLCSESVPFLFGVSKKNI